MSDFGLSFWVAGAWTSTYYDVLGLLSGCLTLASLFEKLGWGIGLTTMYLADLSGGCLSWPLFLGGWVWTLAVPGLFSTRSLPRTLAGACNFGGAGGSLACTVVIAQKSFKPHIHFLPMRRITLSLLRARAFNMNFRYIGRILASMPDPGPSSWKAGPRQRLWPSGVCLSLASLSERSGWTTGRIRLREERCLFRSQAGV